jgi:hypothetical protein
MDEINQEDSLDRQLREAAPYIEDGGFTARVLQQLPAPRRRGQSLRPVILIGMSLLASAVAYVLSDGGRFVVVGMTRLTVLLPSLWIFLFALGTGIVVMAGGLVAAMSKTSDLRS